MSRVKLGWEIKESGVINLIFYIISQSNPLPISSYSTFLPFLFSPQLRATSYQLSDSLDL